MVDVGGSFVKLMVSGQTEVRRFESGHQLSAQLMVEKTLETAAEWEFEVVSLGYPGRVEKGLPAREPVNLADGWVDFDYEQAFGRPVRIINDAALQALANYEGGRMIFLGLGTGIGSAMVVDDLIIPLELGNLRLRRRRTLVDLLSSRALDHHGREKWLKALHKAVEMIQATFTPSDLVLGGGNARLLDPLPAGCRYSANEEAFPGAERLWGDAQGIEADPGQTTWDINRV